MYVLVYLQNHPRCTFISIHKEGRAVLSTHCYGHMASEQHPCGNCEPSITKCYTVHNYLAITGRYCKPLKESLTTCILCTYSTIHVSTLIIRNAGEAHVQHKRTGDWSGQTQHHPAVQACMHAALSSQCCLDIHFEDDSVRTINGASRAHCRNFSLLNSEQACMSFPATETKVAERQSRGKTLHPWPRMRPAISQDSAAKKNTQTLKLYCTVHVHEQCHLSYKPRKHRALAFQPVSELLAMIEVYEIAEILGFDLQLKSSCPRLEYSHNCHHHKPKYTALSCSISTRGSQRNPEHVHQGAAWLYSLYFEGACPH